MRLLSVLLGVGLVLGLMVYVLDRVGEQGQQTAGDVGVRVLPGGIVVPPADGPAPAAGNVVDAAKTVACAGAANALRTAQEAYLALNGRYADLATLVQEGMLRAPTTDLYRVESTDGFATFRLVGINGCP